MCAKNQQFEKLFITVQAILKSMKVSLRVTDSPRMIVMLLSFNLLASWLMLSINPCPNTNVKRIYFGYYSNTDCIYLLRKGSHCCIGRRGFFVGNDGV
jgi:hypothetical protein